MHARTRLQSAVLLVTAMTIATFLVALLVATYAPKDETYVDPDGWGQLGFNLAAGKGLIGPDGKPSAVRGPVVPIIFALCSLVFGPSLEVLTVTLCAFFALANGILGIIVQRVFHDLRITFLAMLIYAGYTPAFPWFCNVFSEPIFTAFVALFVLAWLVALEKGGGWYVLMGVALALAALCRPVMYFFLPIVLLYTVFTTGLKRRALQAVGLCVAGFLVLEIPWVIRNYQTLGQLIVTTSGDGINIYIATWYQQANWMGNVSHDPTRFPPAGQGFFSLPIEQQNALYRKMAWENIREAPVQVLLLIPKRFLMFLFQLGPTGWAPSLKTLVLGGALYLLACFAYGFATSAQRLRCAPCLLLFGFNVLFHSLLVAEFRYSHPVQPYVFLLAAAGAVFLFDRLIARRKAVPVEREVAALTS